MILGIANLEGRHGIPFRAVKHFGGRTEVSGQNTLVEHDDSSPFASYFLRIQEYPRISNYLYIEVLVILELEEEGMAKEDLFFILKKLLQTDTYLEFLLQLDEADLRTLIACIRDRVDKK